MKFPPFVRRFSGRSCVHGVKKRERKRRRKKSKEDTKEREDRTEKGGTAQAEESPSISSMRNPTIFFDYALAGIEMNTASIIKIWENMEKTQASPEEVYEVLNNDDETTNEVVEGGNNDDDVDDRPRRCRCGTNDARNDTEWRALGAIAKHTRATSIAPARHQAHDCLSTEGLAGGCFDSGSPVQSVARGGLRGVRGVLLPDTSAPSGEWWRI
ncbi:hypothetical protein WH47_07538 [Habropoda laboriosa]|uniref:Uncharacterized protein n=1 Tax=Habropoda laboriosa TaxID=597456 RepID=A0A0L7RG37_9HYME|nr:hypothetical protein WH47_07538 [Habropoda laboriosa]